MSDQSESIGNLVKALVEVQGSIKAAKKESENPYFHSKYADLGSVWDSCRSLLKANGLVVIQTTKVVGPDVALVSTLAHTSGEWIKGELLLIPVKRDPQGIGSAISYARRYSLAALLGIVADEDDDGNAATGLKDAKAYVGPSKQFAPALGNAGGGLPDVVKDAHAGVGDFITDCFHLSDPMTSKKNGKVYRKAVGRDQKTYFVWEDKVAADLQIANGGLVTVELETDGGFTKIKQVMS